MAERDFELLHRDAECCHRKAGGRLSELTAGSAAACASACAASQEVFACRFFEFSSRSGHCVLCAGCQITANRTHLLGREVWARRPYEWGATESTRCLGRPPLGSTPRPERAPDVHIAVSLAAFEVDAWIEALIQNALRHTQPSTGIMLHLNRATTYAPCLIGRWNDSIGRLGVAAERVTVRWGTGSILWAHLANARAIAWRWPTVRYVVMQASNMMWVRPGMEARVSELHTSAAAREPTSRQAVKALHKLRTKDAIFRAILATGGPRGAAPAWNYHEGSFYPMRTLLRFRAFVLAQLGDAGGDDERRARLRARVLAARWYPEEFWLPTWTLSAGGGGMARRASAPGGLQVLQVCYNNDSAYDRERVPNCASPADAEAVQRGAMVGRYAVKRVHRALGGDKAHVVTALLRGDGILGPRPPGLDALLRCRARDWPIRYGT